MNGEIELKIPVDHTVEFLSLYEEKLKKLTEEVKKVEKIISILRVANSDFENPSQSHIQLTVNNPSLPIEKLANGYIKQWTWQKKIMFVLNQTLSKMTSKALEQYVINNYEPELKSVETRVRSTISGQVSLMASKGLIGREKNEIDEYVHFTIEKKQINSESGLFNTSVSD